MKLKGLILAAVLAAGICETAIAGLAEGISAAANAAAEHYRNAAEMERQLEQQKRLIEYQHKLEIQRIQQQRELEDQRRQEVLQRQRLAEEDARKSAAEENRRAINTGTGFFINPDGHLVTNNHVLVDKTDFAIRDVRGRFYRAEVVARDEKRDLALLKVQGTFPALRIASSSSVSKGQRVLAVGYPQISIQGNESKVTDGIVSSFSGIKNDDNWFQISVPIQGGNSGGPLVTEAGAVIGVVVASVNVARFYSLTGNLPQNVNYAIKSSVLLDFLSQRRISNTGAARGKLSIDAVDSATVLVVAKNGAIDVSYAVSPEQAARDERERIKQAAEVAKRRQAEEIAESRRLAAEAVEEAKRVRMIAAENKRLEKELAAEAAKREMEAKKAEAERRTHEARIAKRDAAVKMEIPDWQEIKQSNLFNAWLREQPDKASEDSASLNPADVIGVVTRYKLVQSEFAAKLLEREEAEHWRRADRAVDSATAQNYLDRYPTGRYVSEAQAKLAAEREGREAEMRPGRVFRDCADCPEMVIVPTGSFEMGGIRPSAKPLHRVSVGSFALGKTEVTQRHWKVVMGRNPSFFGQCGEDCPVERVSWGDAQEFARKLSQMTGKRYRLPSEAEWEYACRASGQHEYCGGDDINTVAWYGGFLDSGNGDNKTHIVAGKQANGWGLYDMTGNVSEWTQDCWNDDYNGAPVDGSAWTSGACDRRVMRGGSVFQMPGGNYAANRDYLTSTYVDKKWGFRIARTLP